jgi:hypothetical protein
MRTNWSSSCFRKSFFVVFGCLLFGNSLFAQQTKITDYVIFGGQKNLALPQSTPGAPGYGVQLGSAANIQGGSIGSYHLVKSTGDVIIGTNSTPTNIYSGGIIQLASNNVVNGKITAANQFTLPSLLPGGSTILSVGSSATLGNNIGGGFTQGNIDVNGSIVIGGGSVLGKVTIPPNKPPPGPITYTYSGPAPAGGPVVRAAPTLPTLPVLPDTVIFHAAGSTDKTSGTITPGFYGNLTIGGNTTVTLSGPGTYVFKSITSTGPNSQIVFDFINPTTTGNFRIYVYGNVVLNRLSASIINGGSASRIYTVTHGKGSVAWDMSNGSNGTSNTAIWFGSIWAPFGAIVLGSPNGPSSFVTGALWSGTQVNIQGTATVNYAPFNFCEPNVDAGKDTLALDFNGMAKLTGSSTTAGATYSWTASNGGVITPPTNTSQITVTASGTYTLTVTAGGCSASDEVIVTSKLKQIIGSELQAIYESDYNPNNPNYNPNKPPSPFFLIQNGYVKIDIIAIEGQKQNVLNLLQQTTPEDYGLINIIPNGLSPLTITGDLPIRNVLKLNALGNIINYCRPYYQAILFNANDDASLGKDTSKVGKVRSAGDTTMRSHRVKGGYSIYGDGIKIGVISDSYANVLSGNTLPDNATYQPIIVPPYSSYGAVPVGSINGTPQTFRINTADVDILNGDLPGPNVFGYNKNVHVLLDFPSGRTDEGRAMLQHVHDVAPAAELYFRTGFYTAGDFAAGIKELANNGCNIIVDDVTYTTEPFFIDGVVAKAVNEVKAAPQNVTYVSAAGNFANRSYENPFSAKVISGGVLNGKTAHNFNPAGNDVFQKIRLAPGNYVFVFQWVDDFYSLTSQTGGTKNDLDIFLTKVKMVRV